MIAGFDQASSGRILLGGRDVGGLPPFKRPVNTVFQSYALFPHMTVAQNVGLRPRDARAAEGRDRRAGRRDAAAGAHGGAGQPRHQPDLGRPAAARGPGARAGAASRGAAARRAAVGAGPQAPQGHADRAQAAAARHRHHLRLRHARPGGGADDVRPDRRDEPRQGAPGRHARARSTTTRPSASSPTSSARPTCSRASWSASTAPAGMVRLAAGLEVPARVPAGAPRRARLRSWCGPEHAGADRRPTRAGLPATSTMRSSSVPTPSTICAWPSGDAVRRAQPEHQCRRRRLQAGRPAQRADRRQPSRCCAIDAPPPPARTRARERWLLLAPALAAARGRAPSARWRSW